MTLMSSWADGLRPRRYFCPLGCRDTYLWTRVRLGLLARGSAGVRLEQNLSVGVVILSLPRNTRKVK